MIDELETVKQARPAVPPASEEVRVIARRALEGKIAGASSPRRRALRGRVPSAWTLVPVLSVVVVVAIVAVFLGLRPQSSGRNGAASVGKRELVFRVRPNPRYPSINAGVMERIVPLVRERLAAASLVGTTVAVAKHDLTVAYPAGTGITADQVVGALEEKGAVFYDWEQNVLTPKGTFAASGLPSGDRASLQLSRGAGSESSVAGSLPLYQAVGLAARRREGVGYSNSRPFPEYFMFGRSGSPACMAAERHFANQVVPVTAHCYLAGPAPSTRDLDQALPPGVKPTAKGTTTVVVPQGWVVVEAMRSVVILHSPWRDPSARYYVLRDRAGLFSDELTTPRASTDPVGQPDIAFGFDSQGRRAFLDLTAQIAHRGRLVSRPGERLFQHFAVVLDNQLVTVPFIDYRQTPDGIPGNAGAQLSGSFTKATVRRILAEITPLPHLKLLGARRGTADLR